MVGIHNIAYSLVDFYRSQNFDLRYWLIRLKLANFVVYLLADLLLKLVWKIVLLNEHFSNLIHGYKGLVDIPQKHFFELLALHVHINLYWNVSRLLRVFKFLEFVLLKRVIWLQGAEYRADYLFDLHSNILFNYK